MSNIIDKIQVSGVTYDLPSGGGNATVELTQAEYDALVSAGTVSSNTYYIITDAQAGDLTQYWTSAQTQSAITQATSGKVNTSSVVSSVTSASTDSEIPTAKAVWEAASGGSITIDPSLDSGSTNAVANSAITTALDNKANLSDVVLYNYGNPSTYSTAFVESKTAYRIVVNGLSNIVWYFRVYDGSNFVTYGVNNTGNFYDFYGNKTDTPYFINTDLTNYSSGTFDICFNSNSIYADYFGNTINLTFTIYESFSIKPLKTQVIENTTALSGKQETLVSGTNIKTINNESILGSGNITVQGGGSITIDPTLDSGSTNAVANSAITTALNAKVNNDTLSGYVTTDTAQEITGAKTFLWSDSNNKPIIFKQTANNAKLGFIMNNSASTNNELATFELRPDTYTDSSSVKHPLLYLGHYRNTATANAGVVQTMVGFRQYDQKGSAAYHYLMPLPAEAKTPFSLTTSFKNYFAPLGFKNGVTMITTDNTGVADFSNVLGGLKLVKLTQQEYEALTTKDDNTVYFVGDSTNGYTMKLGSANVN